VFSRARKRPLRARTAEDLSQKPQKGLSIDLLGAAWCDRERVVDAIVNCHVGLERVQLRDPGYGCKAFKRLRVLAVDAGLARHLVALGRAIEENVTVIADMQRPREVTDHLRAMRAEAAVAKRTLDAATEDSPPPRPPIGPQP
jgi:hypothetical protein